MKWMIFYDDGTTYSDVDGSPFDAPSRGVQIICHECPDVGRTLNGKEDYYWWNGTRWFGGDQFGLFDYLISNGPKKVIFGRVIDNESFQKIIKQATTHPYLPNKSARSKEDMRW